jgi:hypothetical protein
MYTGSEDNISNMSVKCNCMRVLVVDEIEAAACDMIADIDSTTQRSAGKLFKYGRHDTTPRAFGGLNVLLLGDFWQLPPMGIAVMSNPFGQKVLESAHANSAMSMFWLAAGTHSLQKWTKTGQRVMHLQVNKRSGRDVWFSQLLDTCRLGSMTMDDYNFLHGFPTKEPPACTACAGAYKHKMGVAIASKDVDWEQAWHEIKAAECKDCQHERARRRRVVGCEDVGGLSVEEARAILDNDRFTDGLFITECNKPVCLYSLTRSRLFAKQRKQQLLWIQAEDSPPHEHFAHYSRADLAEVKAKWLTPTYHARKTGGILSLLPCVFGMPIRVTGGQGADCKACGIHNGTKGWVRGWLLHDEDKKALQKNTEQEVVLAHLPQLIWIETVQELKQQHPNAPHKNWFPLKPVTNLWTLDAAEHMEITRKGFAAVPDFSSTIHVATGRTLNACLPDLGGLEEPPSLAAMMRGYIALSRAVDADGVVIVRPFSPRLFQQGEQPFPTLLLKVLQGQVPESELAARCLETKQNTKHSKEERMLKHMKLQCGLCAAVKNGEDFVKDLPGPFGQNFLQRALAPGPFRRCVVCTGEHREAGAKHVCCGCKRSLPKDCFSASQWKNRFKERHVQCLECAREAELGCSREAKLRCFLCDTMTEAHFSQSAKHNKAGRLARCMDCARPRCSNPSCQTCKICRVPSCRDTEWCEAWWLTSLLKRCVCPITEKPQRFRVEVAVPSVFQTC